MPKLRQIYWLIISKIIKYKYILFHSSLPYSKSLAPNQNSAGRQRTEFCLCYLLLTDTDK